MRLDKIPRAATAADADAHKVAEQRRIQENTGKLFRSGQLPGDEMVLEGDYDNPTSLIVDVQRALANQGRRFTTEALRALVTDTDGDGRYEIDTTSFGRGAYLYLRRTLPVPMSQYVNAALTTAGSPNTVRQTRSILIRDLSEILGRTVLHGDKATVVEALRQLRTTGDMPLYAIVKERYLNAYFAHIGGQGDVVETFRVQHMPLLPTIYGERHMEPVTIGDCTALAEISRDLDKAAGVRQTRFIGIRVADDARPGQAVGHRMLLSRLDERHYLFSNNTDQQLIPAELIAKYGLERAVQLITIAACPAQVNSSNGPALTIKEMHEFLTRSLPDIAAAPVMIQKGFAQAYALRFEAFLQRTPLTMANLSEALQKAQTLLQGYTLDPESRAVLTTRLEDLLSRATKHLAQQTPAAPHAAWMKALAIMQEMQLSNGFIQQIRSEFVTILSREAKAMATTDLTAPQRTAFIHDVTRTIRSARSTLDTATWQALAARLTKHAMCWLTARIDLDAPAFTAARIHAAAELYASGNWSDGKQAFQFVVLNDIAEVYLRATFPKSDVREAEPEKLRRVIPQLQALLKILPDKNHADILRTYFFESIAHETFPLHHIDHSCRNDRYEKAIQRLQRAIAQFPELAPFIEAEIVRDVEFRTDAPERTLRARNYTQDFPQLAAHLQALSRR